MHLNLTFATFDGRRFSCVDVIDKNTCKKIGYIRSDGNSFGSSGGIFISLFDGKYRTSVNSRLECWGFIKGVEAVLNHMTSIGVTKSECEVA